MAEVFLLLPSILYLLLLLLFLSYGSVSVCVCVEYVLGSVGNKILLFKYLRVHQKSENLLQIEFDLVTLFEGK